MEILVSESVFLYFWCRNGVPTPLFLAIHPWSCDTCAKYHELLQSTYAYCGDVCKLCLVDPRLFGKGKARVDAKQFLLGDVATVCARNRRVWNATSGKLRWINEIVQSPFLTEMLNKHKLRHTSVEKRLLRWMWNLANTRPTACKGTISLLRRTRGQLCWCSIRKFMAKY